MKMKRIASLLLAFLLFAGTFTSFTSMNVSADGETGETTTTEDEENKDDEEDDSDVDYTAVVYKTAQEKLNSMTLRVQNDNYELYSFAKTGEIALRDKRTGQILFSNPYDIAESKSSTETKEELLSQLIVLFENSEGKSQEYYSYTEAAKRDQITVKNIKNGLRVEYAMGRTETRKLVPQMITKERFETVIWAKIEANATAFEKTKFESFYLLKDAAECVDEKSRTDLYLQFPITKKYAVYVIGSDTKDREYNQLEEIIKKYVPEYTYEELEYDHDLTEYTSTTTAPPLFRMAIEYKLEDTGLSATLAANSISFSEANYKLTSVTLLPFFGAGNYKEYEGYTFMPDGSGTLTRFEDMATNSTSVNIKSKVYGQDFAYYTNEAKHRQTIRLPVFGIVENVYDKEFALVDVDRKYYYDENGDIVYKSIKLENMFTPEGKLNESISSLSSVNNVFYNSDGELVWLTPNVKGVAFYDEAGNVLTELPENGVFYQGLLDANGQPTGETVKATNILPEDGKYYDKDGNLVATKLPINSDTMKYYDENGEFVQEGEPEDMVYRDAWNNLIAKASVTSTKETKEDKGYFAILTEGDSLADIMTTSGAAEHTYASIYTTFYPRPSDKYNLSDASSVGSNMMWTVTSKRKYTGNYTIKYYMLTDETKAEEYIEYLKNPEAITGKADDAESTDEDDDEVFVPLTKDEDFADTYYKADYMGMVNACRDYYEQSGILTRLTSENVKDSIPLYVETMGVIKSTKRILSVPVTVKLPLTTFDDIQTMNEALKANGITNVNYKLTGFANGGMTSTVPAKLKWEKAAGGSSGFEDLMSYANENGVGVYPDFDFSYVGAVANFDGFSYKKHAVKTMDNRYISKREYDPAYQTFSNTFYDPISPSVFEYFYDKLSPKLLKYKPTGISAATLGSDLNSDFDKKDPYNREDSKEFVIELLAKMKADYGSVMVSGGNSYVLPYVDHILEVPLDSSQFLRSSDAIPFYGMVLHGYVNFTGNALNMAGDIDYEILKAIENGASMYFILAYQNTDKLKENYLYQKYYSVNFQIWSESGLYEEYNRLNEALSDVQDKLIVDHEFITGMRVLTAEEIAQAEADKLKQEMEESSRLEEEAKKTESTETELPVESEDETEAPVEDQPEENNPDTEVPDDNTEEEIDYDNFVDNGKIVKVTYEGGKTFILNYNNYKVNVDGVEIDALDFAVIQEGGQK